MPRPPRLLVPDQPTVYHVISRCYLPGFPLGDVEKEVLLTIIRRFAAIYFAEVLGFCLMGNHIHLLIRMQPASCVSDEMVLERFQSLFGENAVLAGKRLNDYRERWSSLSSLMKEIKQTFARFYNRRHGRKGPFWGERFRSVIVEDGRTLVNCLAYIDLNPVRAGIAARPEDYRWCSLGYHLQSGNEHDFLSLDLGMVDWDIEPGPERLRLYREFVYRTGALDTGKGVIDARMLARAESRNFEYTRMDRFAMRTRWFTDGAILGTKAFVADVGKKLDLAGPGRQEPREVEGLDGCYSYRGLSEVL